ncbi:very-long-chain 3-oxoacyl-CoA reductase-like [Lycorma delicatula]|uniref:very-long-chain 3-oxoacyl-CoA reductase-like n=1 Tax=Lycorma delicatula TaxID=130591 RepID=UPI003F5119D3
MILLNLKTLCHVLFYVYSLYNVLIFLKYVINRLILPLFWKQINYKNMGQWAEEKYNIKTKIVVADFKDTEKVIPEIRNELSNMDVGVLINNVGMALELAKFIDNNKRKVNDIINVNVKSVVCMCSAVMDIMLNKQKGVIINVSSLLSVLPCPNVTVYGATKEFISKSLIEIFPMFYTKLMETLESLIPKKSNCKQKLQKIVL